MLLGHKEIKEEKNFFDRLSICCDVHYVLHFFFLGLTAFLCPISFTALYRSAMKEKKGCSSKCNAREKKDAELAVVKTDEPTNFNQSSFLSQVAEIEEARKSLFNAKNNKGK